FYCLTFVIHSHSFDIFSLLASRFSLLASQDDANGCEQTPPLCHLAHSSPNSPYKKKTRVIVLVVIETNKKGTPKDAFHLNQRSIVN
ncbi:hypothetical protein, partial [Enterovibrio norvegicus]|uniref:hypothetical protein n=1 Tax=Enterovibrio norvegicus TaxID=188144 RepID=UPI00355430AC